MFITDLYETAAFLEKKLNINMYLDLVFDEEELNHYFNYSYDYVEDVIKLQFEVDEGEASVIINKAFSEDFDYELNATLKSHIKNTLKNVK